MRHSIRLQSLLVFLLLLGGWGCAPALDCSNLPSPGSCTRVLFIGNSYTYVNDLPATFADLARAGGHQTAVGASAQGGWMLADHVKSSDTIAKISSEGWKFVVLQEQSEIPSVPASRTQIMYPAARVLVGDIEAAGAKPLLFDTWAHRDGWPVNGMPDYASMQGRIDDGYILMSQSFNVPLVPVGVAWHSVRNLYPQINLWQSDGSHPTEEGTYLAACVFYADIFRQSPAGLSYQANLSDDTAHALQGVAADTVFNGQWGIP
ncbi:MAG TPA: DUF4886 domain-containing protein [Anaerolineales bacterium]|nr:DUF4886 domain-containing protein [Anaerolineales bacterium]